MDNLTAILIIEGQEKVSEDEEIAAWQHLIDNRMVWQLQGSYGRFASNLIATGICHARTEKDKQ